ncbi:MAG: hypothetical protein U9N59_08170 [Campylobacterota bacterium]|nr:hypothetical protein [Campylobacterota bacterium]
MQLKLNVNDVKANILLSFLDVFKQDDLIKDYQVIDSKNNYTDYENEILEDLKDLKSSMYESGIKTNKYIEINDI